MIVIPANQNVEEAISVRRYWDSAPFVATRGNRVKIRWESNDSLLVICDSCGLETIDLVQKWDHVGPVKVFYQGFPRYEKIR